MLKLRAVAYEDGYAVYQEGDRIYLIRPPYISRNKIPATETAVERAITIYGYAASEREFDSLSALITHLDAERIKHRKAAGEPDLSEEEVSQFIQKAPLNVIQDFLQRIDKELIPAHEWNAASRLLADILLNPSVQASPILMQQCANLLRKSQQGAEHPLTSHNGLFSDEVSLKARFPQAPEYAFALSKQIRQAGRLIDMGSHSLPSKKAA